MAGRQRALRPTTVRNYRSHLDNYIVPVIGDIKLTDLRAHHVERLIAVTTKGKRGRPVAPNTVRRMHATLRSALTSAVKRRLIPFNVAMYVELPAAGGGGLEVWQAEQVSRFLASARDDRLVALYRLVIVTRMRRGELLGLRWRDVELDHRVLRVAQQLLDVNGQLYLGPPKTKRGIRSVPFDSATARSLKTHAAEQAGERLAAGEAWQDHGLVFTRLNGRPLRPEYVTRHFQRLAADAGLPVLRFHDLRHLSASLALEAGVPMKVVSDRLGHSSTTITADLYTHVSSEMVREAATAIAGVLDVQASHTRGSHPGVTRSKDGRRRTQ